MVCNQHQYSSPNSISPITYLLYVVWNIRSGLDELKQRTDPFGGRKRRISVFKSYPEPSFSISFICPCPPASITPLTSFTDWAHNAHSITVLRIQNAHYVSSLWIDGIRMGLVMGFSHKRLDVYHRSPDLSHNRPDLSHNLAHIMWIISHWLLSRVPFRPLLGISSSLVHLCYNTFQDLSWPPGGKYWAEGPLTADIFSW